MEQLDLLIAGAGLHGLAMAKTYLQVHPTANVLVADQAPSVGGTWGAERLYPGLKTNNVVGSYEFADYPMVLERYGLKPGDHIPGAVVHQYLSDFATHHELNRCISLETKVTAAALQDDNTWVVQLRNVADGSSRSILVKKLVVATGLTSEPLIPTFPGQEAFAGEIFHAKELKTRFESLATKNSIVVVGANKSAWDVCYQAATASKDAKVHMVIRPSGGGPSYLWPKSFKWGPLELSLAYLANTRALAPLDPSPFASPGGGLSGRLRNILHQTKVGRKASQLFWNKLDKRIKRLHGYSSHPQLAKLEPWTTPFWIGNSLSTHNYETNWFDLVREGRIEIHIGEISSLSGNQVTISDGEQLDAEAIVCCTGWKLDPPIDIQPPEASGLSNDANETPEAKLDMAKAFDYIHEKIPYLPTLPVRTSQAPSPLGSQPGTTQRQEDNQQQQQTQQQQSAPANPFHLHRHTVPWQPPLLQRQNLAYLGMTSVIHAALAAQLQALWITAYLHGEVPHLREEVVDLDAVRYEAVLQGVYQGLRRPREAGGAAGKFPEYVFDSLVFADTLMRDLGLNPKRKPSFWREYLETYTVRDYRGVVEEWIEKRQKSS